jgi:hypothetical protein
MVRNTAVHQLHARVHTPPSVNVRGDLMCGGDPLPARGVTFSPSWFQPLPQGGEREIVARYIDQLAALVAG